MSSVPLDAPAWLREPRGGLFSSGRVRIGRFRRHPAEPDFATAGQNDEHVIVFPRLAVRIAQEGRRAVVADSTQVMLYEAGRAYSRSAVAPEGDRCDWFAFAAEDVAAALAPAPGGAGPPPGFAAPSVPALEALVLRERRLFLAAASPRSDALAVEEEALALLHDALAPVRDARAPAQREPPPSWRALAAEAQALLARSFAARVTLSGLAGALGCSPFHLCRAFHAATGRTVHRHLTALRLHAALERVPERQRDLAALALELGFAHHAHFTAAFRRAFGITPNQWALRARAAVRARS